MTHALDLDGGGDVDPAGFGFGRPAGANVRFRSPAVGALAERVARLEAKQPQTVTEVRREAGGAVIFLFGAFCALWAQNTGRNAWLWFFAGMFFNVVSVLVLLAKNSDDRREARGEPADNSPMVIVAAVVGLVLLAAMAVAVYWTMAR